MSALTTATSSLNPGNVTAKPHGILAGTSNALNTANGGASSNAGVANSANSGLANAYDFSRFRYVMLIYSRMFLSDEEIVVMDMLLHEEKALTEKDLCDRSAIHERQLREILNKLISKHVLVKEQINTFAFMTIVSNTRGIQNTAVVNTSSLGDSSSNSGSSSVGGDSVGGSSCSNSGSGASSNGSGSSTAKRTNSSNNSAETENERDGSSAGSTGMGGHDRSMPVTSQAPFYYRINNNILIIIRHVLNKLNSSIIKLINDNKMKDDFLCPKCSMNYSSLQAQCLDMDPVDAHFLCSKCHHKLQLQDNEKAITAAIDLQSRVNKQFVLLTKSLDSTEGMEIPIFPPYRRTDKNIDKLMQQRAGTAATGGGSSGSSVGSDVTENTISANESGNSDFKLQIKHSISDDFSLNRKEMPDWLKINQDTITPTAAGRGGGGTGAGGGVGAMVRSGQSIGLVSNRTTNATHSSSSNNTGGLIKKPYAGGSIVGAHRRLHSGSSSIGSSSSSSNISSNSNEEVCDDKHNAPKMPIKFSIGNRKK